ncbi:hypothetical protein [Arenibaculum pallidiluteum]|uniref:hypothetical protein n=1 Tax=Arenibaculum pallidiluteum TaxID=2812559 RepID=UPI001A960AEF|nr:hypothetical protein [Arenibaculum pallidiluteum]
MGYIMEAAQRAAALIRNAIAGSPAAKPQAPEPAQFSPTPSTPASTPPSTTAAKPPVRSAADDGQERARRQLAESIVRQHRAVFVQLFSEGQAGAVRSSVTGAAIERAFSAGAGGNLSPHAFRMVVVGSGIGSAPNDGITLTEMGAAVLREQLGKGSSTVH